MKRPKSYYKKCASRKKFKSDSKLDVGMKGILITCNNAEGRCVREAYNILMEYADQLYGSETEKEADSEGRCVREAYNILMEYADQLYGSETEKEADSDGGSDEDIAESLQKEVEAMQKTRKQKKFRFLSVDSRAKNVVFIKTNIPDDPANLVHHMLKDIQAKGQTMSHFILRIHPVSITCRANLAQIEKAAIEIFTPHFHGPGAMDTTFAILFKSRNNEEVVKDEVVAVIATAVKSDKTHNHRVSLGDPEHTIIVEVICNVCCISVVKDYNKLKKYNLHELAWDDANKETKREHSFSRSSNPGRGSKELVSNLEERCSKDKDAQEELSNVDCAGEKEACENDNGKKDDKTKQDDVSEKTKIERNSDDSGSESVVKIPSLEENAAQADEVRTHVGDEGKECNNQQEPCADNQNVTEEDGFKLFAS